MTAEETAFALAMSALTKKERKRVRRAMKVRQKAFELIGEPYDTSQKVVALRRCDPRLADHREHYMRVARVLETWRKTIEY